MNDRPIFEDCREHTPCGALSIFTVDTRTDLVVYQTFGTLTPPMVSASKCQRCGWKFMCPKYKALDRAVKAGDTIDVLKALCE
ncbi:MAG: hypothetical protein RR338_02970 [Clostridia bacterium]